jgi:hypothetical protein
MVIKPLPWFQRYESRCDHFLNSQVGIVLTNDKNLPTETNFSVGSILTPLLGKKDEGSISMSPTKPQGQGSMITKTSSSALGEGNRHTSHLKSQQTD